MSGTKSSTFFWSDWMSDPGLRRSSYAARGLWMDMLCLAAMSDRIGYVEYESSDIARMTGGTVEQVESLTSELEKNGVFSRNRRGVIYSRRMVNAEKMRAVSVRNGKKGGNPNLRKSTGNKNSDNQSANPIGKEGVPPIGARPLPKPSPLPSPEAKLSIATDWQALETHLRKAAGWEREPAPNLSVVGPIAALVEQGADLDRDVLPVVKAHAPNVRTRTSWKYFVGPITDAMNARREAGAKLNGNGAGTPIDWRTFDRHRYEMLVEHAKRRDEWPEAWGPTDRIPNDLVDDEIRRIINRVRA